METANNNVELSYLRNAGERLKTERNLCAKKMIVNAGLLKAGKSTLFNAIAGRDIFASDVVRATTENQKVELEKYFLLDTPGLDAEEKDTQSAFFGYEEADILIFVHNVQEGELNQAEIDNLSSIWRLFGNDIAFFQNTFLILTHKDQMESKYMNIRKCIVDQCEHIFGTMFQRVFCVDSYGYRKGIVENKELLKQESGIPELLEAIEYCALQESGLRKARFDVKKGKLLSEIEETLVALKGIIPEREAVPVPDAIEEEMKRLSDGAISAIRVKGVTLPGCGSYRGYGIARNYKEYDSEYSAKTAGKEAIAEGIKRIAKAAKMDALRIVENAEAYINLANIPKEMADWLSDAYEKMRLRALEAGITIRTNYSVALRDPSKTVSKSSKLEKAKEELDYARRNARNIDMASFSSPSSYADRYSYNLSIDYDTREKWVKGMFGGEKCKTVFVYSYDVQGAIDDIAEDAADKVSEVREQASEAVRTAFEEIKEDMGKQFEALTEEILAEVSSHIKEIKRKEREYHRKREEAARQIAELESCRRAVEAVEW